ncbi:hypothetical protein F5X97DRAFT_294464 [Nemania serpens]|nr:hypothetical protein F5X97DRAFT_294464 [Nemania serpens]
MLCVVYLPILALAPVYRLFGYPIETRLSYDYARAFRQRLGRLDRQSIGLERLSFSTFLRSALQARSLRIHHIAALVCIYYKTCI